MMGSVNPPRKIWVRFPPCVRLVVGSCYLLNREPDFQTAQNMFVGKAPVRTETK